MARKSRVQQPVPVRSAGKVDTKVYKTALYARLSAEREDTRVRGTIHNQVSFIRHYVEQQEDMEIYDTYMDDDISGTRFDRPAFERMMSDMRNGRIDCIVVKDLSRLGRDYIETGNLIERVFPMFKVRFVAINDQFDSAKGGAEMIMTVTNIANALYAQDISKKIWSSKHEAMEKGIPLNQVPYGYKVVLNEKRERFMVIDEEAARVVRRIFAEAEAGVATSEIIKGLNEEGILTPSQYRVRNDAEKLSKLSNIHWTCDMISILLKKEVYIGTYITGKDRKCLYKHEKRHTTDKNEWNIFENHHEPIVSKEQFYAAQATRKGSKATKKRNVNLLKGKISCACCGSGVHLHPERHANVYLCTHRKRYGRNSCACLPVKVNDVYAMVFSVIKEQSKMLLDEDEIVRKYNSGSKAKAQKTAYIEAIDKRTRELAHIQKLKSGLYEDYREGLLSENEYLHLNDEYSSRIEKMKSEIDEYRVAARQYDASPLDNSELKENILKIKNKRKLSQEMVDAMVSRVLIHEDKNIEVILSFEDEIRKALQRKKEREGEQA